jgi:hypothetical protein
MLNHLSRNSTPGSEVQNSCKACGRDHKIELTLTGSESGCVASGCLARRRLMLLGSAFGKALEVMAWLAFERAPRRAQCSEYTTRALIDVVSRLARLCLFCMLWSDSCRASRRAFSHQYFQSPRWNMGPGPGPGAGPPDCSRARLCVLVASSNVTLLIFTARSILHVGWTARFQEQRCQKKKNHVPGANKLTLEEGTVLMYMVGPLFFEGGANDHGPYPVFWITGGCMSGDCISTCCSAN